MKKRILTVVIAIAILAGIAVPVRAEETVPEEAVECLTEMPYEALLRISEHLWMLLYRVRLVVCR